MKVRTKMKIYADVHFVGDYPIWLKRLPIIYDRGIDTIFEFHKWLVVNNKCPSFRNKIVMACLEGNMDYDLETAGFPIFRRTEWRRNKQILVRKNLTPHKKRLWDEFLSYYKDNPSLE